MIAFNRYYTRQLTQAEIVALEHRDFVGGFWEEIGTLQLNFLLRHGLQPHHRLLDIGCGPLRCGIPIIRYLDKGNYYGLDINASLIEAGNHELKNEKLTGKKPKLLVNDRFEVERFGVLFDFAIAQSVFTHLDMNLILRCLVKARKTLAPEAKFFCTFFLAPSPAHIASITHEPGGVISNFDSDPFHYSLHEMKWLAETAGFSASFIGHWRHPRNQQMLQLSVLQKD